MKEHMQEKWYWDAGCWCQVMMIIWIVVLAVISCLEYSSIVERVAFFVSVSFVSCLGTAFGVEPIDVLLGLMKRRLCVE